MKRLFFGFASVKEGTKQGGEGGGGRGGSDALPNFKSLNFVLLFLFFSGDTVLFGWRLFGFANWWREHEMGMVR